MPSALVTGLAIIGIGGAAAVTGGLALGAFAPTAAGGGAVFGLGGLGFSFGGAAAGFGIGGTLASMFLGGRTETPSAAGRAALRKQQIADAEMPRGTLYGQVVVGFLKAWSAIPPGFSDDEWETIDGVICDHPSEGPVGVQIGDDYLPITTNDADPEGLILKSGTTAPGDDFFTLLPSDWYVPVTNSKYRRVDNTKKSSATRVIHFAIKFRTDGVPVHDAFQQARAGGNYNDVQRLYDGVSMFHAWIRGNQEIDTLQAGQTRLMFLWQGKNDIADPRAPSFDYENNGSLVVADEVKHLFGIDGADINVSSLNAAADVSDNTGWDPLGTARKYVYNDLIRDDEDKHEALQRAVAHTAGAVFERGKEIIIHAGGARPKVASVGPSDMLSIGVLTPPEEAEIFNAVTPHYVPQMDDDGRLHGELKPVEDVTQTAYQNADGGRRRPVDRQYEGNPLGRRAKFLASIDLEQPRVIEPVGSVYQVRLKREWCVLEKFDVIGITDPDLWSGEIEFQIQAVEIDMMTFQPTITCFPYADSIYTPAQTVTEEPVGVLPRTLPAQRSVPPVIIIGEERMENAFFEWGAGAFGEETYGWNYDDVPGDIFIERVVTHTFSNQRSPATIDMTSLNPTAGLWRGIESTDILVQGGELLRVEGGLVRNDSEGSTQFEARMILSFYDINGDLRPNYDQEVFPETALNSATDWERPFKNFQVPHYDHVSQTAIATARVSVDIKWTEAFPGSGFPRLIVDFASIKERESIRSKYRVDPITVHGTQGYVQIIGSNRDIYPAPQGKGLRIRCTFEAMTDTRSYTGTDDIRYRFRIVRTAVNGTPGASPVFVLEGEFGEEDAAEQKKTPWADRVIEAFDDTAPIYGNNPSEYRYTCTVGVRDPGDNIVSPDGVNAVLTVRARRMEILIDGDQDDDPTP